MERITIIMMNDFQNAFKNAFSITILILSLPLLSISQEYSENKEENIVGHDYLSYHKSQIDFLPIDSIFEKIWQVNLENDNCMPLIQGNLVFPSVVERIVINAESGSMYLFGSEEAIKLFKKEKLDSIICLPAEESISLINIYTNEILFSNKRRLMPGYEGPFFTEDNILYYSDNNILFAYNYLDKKNLWQTNIDRYTNNFYHKYKNYIILNDKNNLLIIEKKTGTIIQKYKTANYYSNIFVGINLFYGNSDEIIKINLETFQQDTLINKTSLYLEKSFTIKDDTLTYAAGGKLYYYLMSKKANIQLPDKRVCSDDFIKIRNYIISTGREDEDGVFTTIYDIKKGLPLYKYFFVKQGGDFTTYDRQLFSFNPKLTDNGLLIGYTFRGEIQAFRFRNK